MSNINSAEKLKTYYEELLRARIKMQGDAVHHLEQICFVNGVSWINHSMATTIDMTWFALRDVNGPVVLIIGGIDRSEDQHKLKMLVKEKVHAVICMGSTPWKYFNAYRDCTGIIVQARDMDEAVHFAKKLSVEAKTVLFAPSCPSYDAFDNYKNRGNTFKKIVLEKIK